MFPFIVHIPYSHASDVHDESRVGACMSMMVVGMSEAQEETQAFDGK